MQNLPSSPADVRRIMVRWLRDHQFDGLYCQDCGCELDDLMPCAARLAIYCVPGYRIPDAEREGFVFIGPDASRTPAPAPYQPHPDAPANRQSTRHGPPGHTPFPLPLGCRHWMTKRS